MQFDSIANSYDQWYDTQKGKQIYEAELECLQVFLLFVIIFLRNSFYVILDKKQNCQKPEKLKDKPQNCSKEQIEKCHGDVKDHSCTKEDR